MKDIFYVNGKFILTSDPMDRGPLMYGDPVQYFGESEIVPLNTHGWKLTGWKPMYLSDVKWTDPYLEAEKWKGIPVVPIDYYYSNARNVLDDLMNSYNQIKGQKQHDDRIIGTYIGKYNVCIDDIIMVNLL